MHSECSVHDDRHMPLTKLHLCDCTDQSPSDVSLCHLDTLSQLFVIDACAASLSGQILAWAQRPAAADGSGVGSRSLDRVAGGIRHDGLLAGGLKSPLEAIEHNQWLFHLVHQESDNRLLRVDAASHEATYRQNLLRVSSKSECSLPCQAEIRLPQAVVAGPQYTLKRTSRDQRSSRGQVA